MLKKLPTRQNDGEPRRQWFADDYIDLYVWYQPGETIVGFQLCYDKAGDERALTWMAKGVFRHERIDTGDSSPFDSRSAVIGQACPFQAKPVRTEFIKRSLELESKLCDLIVEKIDAYSNRQNV